MKIYEFLHRISPQSLDFIQKNLIKIGISKNSRSKTSLKSRRHVYRFFSPNSTANFPQYNNIHPHISHVSKLHRRMLWFRELYFLHISLNYFSSLQMTINSNLFLLYIPMDLNSPPRHALLEYFMVVWVLRSLIRLFFMWRNYFYQLFWGKVRIYCRNFLLGNSNGALQVEILIYVSVFISQSHLTMNVHELREFEGLREGFMSRKPYKCLLTRQEESKNLNQVKNVSFTCRITIKH